MGFVGRSVRSVGRNVVGANEEEEGAGTDTAEGVLLMGFRVVDDVDPPPPLGMLLAIDGRCVGRCCLITGAKVVVVVVVVVGLVGALLFGEGVLRGGEVGVAVGVVVG